MNFFDDGQLSFKRAVEQYSKRLLLLHQNPQVDDIEIVALMREVEIQLVLVRTFELLMRMSIKSAYQCKSVSIALSIDAMPEAVVYPAVAEKTKEDVCNILAKQCTLDLFELKKISTKYLGSFGHIHASLKRLLQKFR